LEKAHFEFTGNLLLALAYTSILATVITATLQTKYQKFTTPTKAGIIFSLEPIISAVLAFFVLREKISNFGFIGGALIFSGLLVSELIDKKTIDHE
jgi:drug/metabolite transporter (DMT)-like permease